MRRVALLAAAVAIGAWTATTAGAPAADLHGRLLTLDMHLDTPALFDRPGWDFGAAHDPAADLAQVDLPRMEAGALDGGFFVIYTDPGPLTAEGYAAALAFARQRSDAIDRVIARHPARILPARTAADAERIARGGKLIAFKSIENSYPLGEDLALLAEFKRRGVALAGPVHSKNNQFADSATDTPRWNGLSPLGRRWVAEMNRLGLVIDASHSSDATFDQLLELSATPVLLSHSSARTAYDHPRNLDDDRIRRLARQGGAMCVSTVFMSEHDMSGDRGELARALDKPDLSEAEARELVARWRALDATQPVWRTDFDAYMKMLLHVIEVAGVDHVCFGADWDGGGGIPGLEDISAQPRITAALVAAGHSDADIEKMWSGNVLRILRAAEAHAAR